VLKVTEGLRSIARQKELYAQGRTKPGPIITQAKPGDSLHHYGCALDCAFTGSDPYLAKLSAGEKRAIWTNFGKLGKIHGFTWGGDWDGDGDQTDQKLHDTPHLELTYGLTLAQIKELYRHGGLTAVWAKFDQIRGVEQASEWTGPLTKYRLLELGELPE
jgi:peptidoglycan L-alanyl-D-glutamate endopeptidase CwlK